MLLNRTQMIPVNRAITKFYLYLLSSFKEFIINFLPHKL